MSRNACSALLLATVFAPFGGGAVAQDRPVGRARHHLIHDAAHDRLLLFGGAQSRAGGAVRDTMLWAWDGATWRVVGGLPPARGNDAAGYDIARQRLVMHGGSALAVREELDDTWEWDGQQWQSMSGARTGARAHHDMVYDPVRQEMVLFGNSDHATANDTWGWNGRDWRLLADAGPPRRGVFALAFDSRRGVVVLFGGYGSGNAILGDTWEWDGRSWREVSTSVAPSPRYDTQMAFDPLRNRMVLFGGRGSEGNLGDTWEYDGINWTRVDVPGPSVRNGHAMAFDPRTGAVLLSGGRNEPNFHDDLWAFDGRWRLLAAP